MSDERPPYLDDLAAARSSAGRQPSAEQITGLRTAVEVRRDAVRAGVVSGPRAARLGSRVRGIAAAAVIVVIGVGAVVLARGDGGGGVVEYAGPLFAPDGEERAAVTVTERGIGRTIELDTDALEILPTGDYYEVWLVGPGDGPESPNRLSAGTFHPDADGVSDITLTGAFDPAKFPRLEITVEPGDGDPAPSGDVALRADIDS